MQATVHRFDPDTQSGAVIRDDGVVVPFSTATFTASSLRHLRVGQRLSVTIDLVRTPEFGNEYITNVTRMWIVGIGDGQPIL